MRTHLYRVDDLTKDERLSFDVVDYSKYVFLTVEREVSFRDIIKHGGKIYTSCRGTRKGDDYYLGVSEITIKDDDDIEDEYEDEITCHVCGNKWGDCLEMSDSDDALHCDSCGSIIAYEREVSVSYSCSVVTKNDKFVEL